ncbi:hypothetical protein AVEN_245474-1 [Araneus ventricosus]|uniref:Uncharacterized protein n=1 Tax=Araneus ventricosus TaxID=182803 RepID=A0A4Y2D5T6_ARAVE|nr:hypothetical protein AVEN_245474-1 [Araneus ventricosus]
MDLVIWNCSQMTRTTPEVAPPLEISRHTSGRIFSPLAYDLTCSRPAYSAELQWNRVSNLDRDLTTRPPQPQLLWSYVCVYVNAVTHKRYQLNG